MDENSLGPSNVFLIFSALSFLGFVYCYFFIRETKGLTDKEKKEIFMPKRFKNVVIDVSNVCLSDH